MAEITDKLARDLAYALVRREEPQAEMDDVEIVHELGTDQVHVTIDDVEYRILASKDRRHWQVQKLVTRYSGSGCEGFFGGRSKTVNWEDEQALDFLVPVEKYVYPDLHNIVLPHQDFHNLFFADSSCEVPPAANVDLHLLSGQRGLCNDVNTLCIVADASYTPEAQQYMLEKISLLRDELLSSLEMSSPWRLSMQVYLLQENGEAAQELAKIKAPAWAVPGKIYLALSEEERDRINTTDDRYTALINDMMAHELAHALGNNLPWATAAGKLEEGRASWAQREISSHSDFSEAMVPARVLRRIEGIPLVAWTEVPQNEGDTPLPLPLAQFSVTRDSALGADRVVVSYQFGENSYMGDWELLGTAHVRLGEVLNLRAMGLLVEETSPEIFTATLVDDAPEHRKTKPADFSCGAESWKAEQKSFIVLEDGTELSAPKGGYTFYGDELTFAQTLELFSRDEQSLADYPHYYCFFEGLGPDLAKKLLQRIDVFAQENEDERGEFPFLATVQELTGWDEEKTQAYFEKFGVFAEDKKYRIGGVCYP